MSSGTWASGQARSLRAGAVVDAVEDAGIAQILVGAGEARGRALRRQARRARRCSCRPDRADIAGRRRSSRRRRRGAAGSARAGSMRCRGLPRHPCVCIPLLPSPISSSWPAAADRASAGILRRLVPRRRRIAGRRVAARLEAGEPAGLGLVAVDREGVVVAAARDGRRGRRSRRSRGRSRCRRCRRSAAR